jgi:hypothetical protein
LSTIWLPGPTAWFVACPCSYVSRHPKALIYEVHAEEMQYQTPKHEVCECPVHHATSAKSTLIVPSQRPVGSPFMTDTPKFGLVLWIRLNPQTSRQDKLPYCCAETRQESIEWLPRISTIPLLLQKALIIIQKPEAESATHIIPNNHTIQKLQSPNYNEERHEYINQLHPLRRRIQIIVP